ncbi:unknown [Brachyspira sp. CAG:484]|nr:unknown [Brachyspira sp. CAG:484]
MLEDLTENEKEIMFLLVQGHNFNGILDFVGIDYPTFIALKKSLFKKLKISRTTEILGLLLQQGFNPDEI